MLMKLTYEHAAVGPGVSYMPSPEDGQILPLDPQANFIDAGES